MNTLHEYVFTHIKYFAELFLERGNLRRKSKQILCSVNLSQNRAVYEIMWKNIVETDRPHMTI